VSIYEKTGQKASVTEGQRALELFTDRHRVLRLFLSYLNDSPPRDKILFLHGDGGNGKSLLLRFLKEYCCRSFDAKEWQRLQSVTDAELVDSIKQASSSSHVPAAYLDFKMEPIGEDRPLEGFSAIMMLRRALSSYKLHFPVLRFALITYLKKTNRDSKEHLQQIFPPEELDLVIAIADAITSTSAGSVMKLLWDIANKQFDIDYHYQKRGIREEKITEIQNIGLPSDLARELPRFFAEDLNAAMSLPGAPKRVVLLFDSHEAFWGQNRDLSDSLYFERDEWFRHLLSRLDLQKGIVVVVAQREPPRWGKADYYPIPNEFLDMQVVGHLSQTDAQQYLDRAGISNPETRQSLITYASIQAGEVHPLYIGLGVDLAAAVQQGGREYISPEGLENLPSWENKGRFLVNTLLRYTGKDLDHAVRGLAATRAFNREIYAELSNTLGYANSDQNFDALTRLSFVWPIQSYGGGWYRIHDLLRTILSKREDEITSHADNLLRITDVTLESYYRAKAEAGEPLLLAEAIYHANRQDWERGLEEWKNAFIRAINDDNLSMCSALLDVRGDLEVRSSYWHARLVSLECDYLERRARYAEAMRGYQQSEQLFSTAAEEDPQDERVYAVWGGMLSKLGMLYFRLSMTTSAVDSLRRAIYLEEKALSRFPDYLYALDQKAQAYQQLGDVFSKLGRDGLASVNYAQAMKVLEQINNVPADSSYGAVAEDKRIRALLAFAELQLKEARFLEAVTSLESIVVHLNGLLQVRPEDTSARISRAIAYMNLGEALRGLLQNEKAIEYYAEAVTNLQEVVRQSPEDTLAHNDLGRVLLLLGGTQLELGNLAQAEHACRQALSAFNRILEIAPDNVLALANRPTALLQLAEVQEKGGNLREAAANVYRAIRASKAALDQEHLNVAVLFGEAKALVKLADLLKREGEHESALDMYKKAVDEYELAESILEGTPTEFRFKGYALINIAEGQLNKEQITEGIKAFEKAITAFDKALARAPNDYAAHQNRGYTLLKLAELRLRRLQIERACDCFRKSVEDLTWLSHTTTGNTEIQNLLAEVGTFLSTRCGTR
jgi:tetratricopeptide (TPR) repeat protein